MRERHFKYTVTDLARVTNRSRQQVWYALRTGKLEPGRFESVLEWIAEVREKEEERCRE